MYVNCECVSEPNRPQMFLIFFSALAVKQMVYHRCDDHHHECAPCFFHSGNGSAMLHALSRTFVMQLCK